MREVLEFVLKNIVTHPDDVKIDTADEAGTTNYLITVHSDDVGRIIGKEGKVIKAIRTIMRVIAIQKGVHVRVSVLSENSAPTEPTEPTPAPEEAPAPEEVPPTDGLTVEV